MISISLIYCCEKVYMDNCEKIDETSLAEKEDFYNHLNMADINNTEYGHAKKVCKICHR